MANLLNNYSQDCVDKEDYFKLLSIYTKSHRLSRPDGSVVPWIDENIHPFTGQWLARSILEERHPGGGKIRERGKDYNHSTYCDLIITGLMGLRPQADGSIVVNPLVPQGLWDYFCLDRVPYHGRNITILYDITGSRYGKGKGLRVFANEQEISASEKIMPVIMRSN
jgi:hypothetical protein